MDVWGVIVLPWPRRGVWEPSEAGVPGAWDDMAIGDCTVAPPAMGDCIVVVVLAWCTRAEITVEIRTNSPTFVVERQTSAAATGGFGRGVDAVGPRNTRAFSRPRARAHPSSEG